MALLAAMMLLFTIAAGALADAPDPASISASVNGSTATVSGSWNWPRADKCTDKWVGWAVDPSDPSDPSDPGDPGDPGNVVSGSTAVRPQNDDNAVHSNGNCGSRSGGKDRSGSWGSISHTYTSPGTYSFCSVIYDLQVEGKTGQPKTDDLIAGGSHRNKDNSADGGGAGSGACTTVTIAAPANVSVRKTVNRATADPGDTLTYTIALTNSGGAPGVIAVTDDIATLLANAAFVSASNGGTLSGSTVGWADVNVPTGGTVYLTMALRLNATGWSTGTTTLTNTAVAAGTNCASGSGAADCRASATVTITPSASVAVRETVNRATASPGDTLTYTIALTNSGGADAASVSVTDSISNLLAKASFVSASNGGSLGGSVVAWTGRGVPAGGSLNLTFSVRVNTTGWTSGTTTLTDTLIVPNTNCAAGSGAAECRATTTISPNANLVVHKTVNASRADPGDTLSYTISIQNTGGADATGVTATDNISALLAKGSFVSATNGGSLAGSTVSWSNLSVDAGATVTVGFSVRLNASGWGSGAATLANTIVVPASDCASGSSNASCHATTTVSVSPNLVVRKSVDATTANPGDTLTYTITVLNTGSGDATDVDVTDSVTSLLAHGSFVSASSGGSLSGSTVSWPNLAVDAGASRTLSFVIHLDTSGWPGVTTTLANTVIVPGSDCSSGSTNSACRVSTAVSTRAILGVRKSVNATSADPGDNLSYTITVQNTGNASATGVDVTDDISDLLVHGAFVSATGGGTLSGNLVRWDNLSVAPGATQTVTFTIHLDTTGWPLGSTALPNVVVVAGSDCAAGSSNSACRVSMSVTAQSKLVVRKVVTATSADPGDNLSYTITVQNKGNATATNVDVTDDIAAVLARASFVSASTGGTLSANVVRWDNRTLAPGDSQTFTFTVKLDVGGWDTGGTSLPNTVVVPGSDCASGASNAACRVSTTVTPRLALSVTKGAAGGSSGPWVASLNATDGDSVWYQIKVTNTGNATLSGVTMKDSPGIPSGQCVAIPATLAPGAGWTCVYFRTIHEGITTNTATVDSAQTASAGDSATVVAGPAAAPAIRVSKTASPAQLPIAGGNVTYTILVTNPGNVALSNITLTDDKCAPLTLQSGDTNSNDRLDTSELWRYTCGASLTATTTNTATVSGTFGTTKVTGSDKVSVTVLLGEPAIHLEKSASPAQLPVGGGTATYTYLVTNVGNGAMSDVKLTDDNCSPVVYVSGDTNNNDRLDLTESWRFGCSATLTATTTNHARVTGSFGDTVVADTDQATVSVATSAPAIHIVKAANPTSLPAGGGSVAYTYVVTNTGNSPLTNVTVIDDGCGSVTFAGGDANSKGRLDIGETWQYRCSATLTSTTTNTATALGRAGTTTVTDTDQATVAVTASNAAINMIDTASPTTLPPTGGSVTYTYVVTNKGNVPLANVSLIDDQCSPVTSAGGDANGNGRLDSNETWTFRCVQTVTATTTNTVLATGFANGTAVTDTDTALVTVGTPQQHTPRIGLTLSVDPVSLPNTGGNVTYTYAVTNKGNVALANITVTDDTCTSVTGPSGDANGNAVLDLTETWTYTCLTALTRTTTTAADASGQADGETVVAVDMATVTVAPPAPTPAPPDSPAPSAGPTTGVPPSANPASGAPASPGASGSTGAVQGATSPPNASPAPAYAVPMNTGSTPTGMVMIMILMLGSMAAVVIMTLSKRTSRL